MSLMSRIWSYAPLAKKKKGVLLEFIGNLESYKNMGAKTKPFIEESLSNFF